MLFRVLPVVAALAAVTVAGTISAHAQTGLWAVATDTCSPDGHKCIRGIVKDGAPFTSREVCEKHALALLRQYNAAHLRVSYIRCVPL
jgi:hypothetical protein